MRNLLLSISFWCLSDLFEDFLISTVPGLGRFFMQHFYLMFEHAFSMRTRPNRISLANIVKYEHVKQSRGWTVILHADIVDKNVKIILKFNISVVNFFLGNSLYRFFSVSRKWQSIITWTLRCQLQWDNAK